MSENPYQSPPGVGSTKESIWAAARRGAKVGAIIGAFPIVALQAIELAFIGYFALTDPDRARYIVERLTPLKMFTVFVSSLLTTTAIGAGGGAALLAARTWGRLKQERHSGR